MNRSMAMNFKPVFYRGPFQRKNLMCRLKRRFDSPQEAVRAHGKHLPYRCPYCKKWHLTKQRATKNRIRKALERQTR